MQDSFDPYREWLDIQDPQRPPNHYALLGIKLLESDPEVIAHAADARMAQVRKVRPGAHLVEWGRLLDAISGAKVCLLDPASREAYDATLSARGSTQPAGPAEPPSAQVYPPTLAVPPTLAGSGRQTPAQRADPAGDWAHTPAETSAGPEVPTPLPPQPWESAPTASGSTPGDASTDPGPSAGADPQVPQPLPVATPVPVAGQPMPPSGTPAGSDSMTAQAPAEGTSQTDAASAQGAAATFTGTSTGPSEKRSLANLLSVAALVALIAGLGGVLYHVLTREPERLARQDADAGQVGPESPALTPESVRPPQPAALREQKKPGPQKHPKHEQFNTSPPQPQPPRPTPGQQHKPAPTSAIGPSAGPQHQPDPAKPPPEPEPEKPAEQLDVEKTEAFGKAVGGVRRAMSERDLDAARRRLETAAANAQTPADQTQLARLQTMLDYLDEFWRAVRESVSKLDPPSELVLGETRIAVVEASRNHLIVKAAGRLHTWAIEEIPTSVLKAIVESSFSKDPASKAIVGTFLAVDSHGDREYARQLWREAARAGVDVEQLMPELEITPDNGWQAGVSRVPPPTDRAELQQAEQSVREAFQQQYAEAGTAAKKLALAEALLARARISDDPDARFVMLREARDLAVALGKPAVAGEAIDQMAKFYTIDAIQLKAAAFEEVGKTARGLSSHREIAQGALRLFQQAVSQKRLDEAARLAQLALDAARNSNSRTLIKQAVAAGEQLEALQKEGGSQR